MAKQISIKENLYDALTVLKGDHSSYSDVIQDLLKRSREQNTEQTGQLSN